jgi:hypothetical protein
VENSTWLRSRDVGTRCAVFSGAVLPTSSNMDTKSVAKNYKTFCTVFGISSVDYGIGYDLMQLIELTTDVRVAVNPDGLIENIATTEEVIAMGLALSDPFENPGIPNPRL